MPWWFWFIPGTMLVMVVTMPLVSKFLKWGSEREKRSGQG